MKYTVKTQIRRGKKRHKPGSTIDLTQEQAARLVAAGAVAPMQEPPQESSGKAQAEVMTVKQLTEKLEELQVEVPTDAKKADLVELYLSAQTQE